MQRDEQADLAVLDPLPNAIAGASLDARYQSAVVDDAVEDLAGGHSGRRRCAVLGRRALSGAHLGVGGRGLRRRKRVRRGGSR